MAKCDKKQDNKTSFNTLKDDPDNLLDVVLAFNKEVDYTSLLNIILTKMMEITNSDAGTLYIIDGGKLHFRILKNNSLNIFQIASSGEEASLPPITLDKDNIENVSAYAAIHNKIIVIEDVYKSDRFNFAGPKNYDKMTGYRTRSMLVLPLVSFWEGDQEVLGVIQLLNSVNPQTGEPAPYDDISNPPATIALSKIASNTLANLTHMQEIHQLFHSFVTVITQAMDERSPSTKDHTQNVSAYCKAFVEYLSNTFPPGHRYHFSKRHQERLVIAALLHDMGKITTPVTILDKSSRLLPDRFNVIKHRLEIKRYQIEIDYLKGLISKEVCDNGSLLLTQAIQLIEHTNSSFKPLSDDEYTKLTRVAGFTFRDIDGNEMPIFDKADVDSLLIRVGTLTAQERTVMQKHVEVTGRLLDQITFWKYYRDVPKWAKDHHEFLDGSGYPYGLKAEEIALESCILTIMDIFEALTATNRPYRKAMPPHKALEILQGMADEGKLHKELVNIFEESKLWERLVGE